MRARLIARDTLRWCSMHRPDFRRGTIFEKGDTHFCRVVVSL